MNKTKRLSFCLFFPNLVFLDLKPIAPKPITKGVIIIRGNTNDNINANIEIA